MSKLNPRQRARARTMWEEEGASYRKIGEKFGVTRQTISKYAKEDGWVRSESHEAIALPTGEEIAVDTTHAVPVEAVIDGEEAAAAETVAQLEARIAQLEAENAALSPDVELNLPETPAQMIEWFGRDYIERIALDEINAERLARRLNPLELQPGDPVLDKAIAATVEKFLARRTRFAGESNLRTLKMAKADPSSPTGYRIAAIPMEPTINNFAAGEAGAREAIEMYRRKGFRLITPQLCQRGPCNAKAKVVSGHLAYQGYCSEAHMADDPFINARKVSGVTGTAQSMASRATGTVLGESTVAFTPGS